MTIRNLPVLSLVITLICAGAWLFVTRTQAQDRNDNPWQAGGPHKVIEATARAVNVDDEASVRALTEGVFSFPHAFQGLPANIEDTIKQRLTQAEIQYLKTGHPGVKEADVANLVNLLADRLHLPDYAKTNVNQVRVLRMSMALSSPVFMGRGMSSPGAQIGESVAPEMSPLQATHVLATMLDQKIINPDYQMTPSEWDQTSHQRMIEKLHQADALKKSAQTTKTSHRLIARSNPRHTEMRQALSAGLSSLTVGDASVIADEAFKTLKLEQ
jgi:hypothetical protein